MAAPSVKKNLHIPQEKKIVGKQSFMWGTEFSPNNLGLFGGSKIGQQDVVVQNKSSVKVGKKS